MKSREKEKKAMLSRRTYSKPQLEKVQLVPDEAVLTACKQTYIHITDAFFDNSGCFIILASCVADGS
jgi:hypothetical protein